MGMSTFQKVVTGVVLALVVWLTFEAGYEAWRQAAGKPQGSPVHEALVQRVKALPPSDQCETRGKPGESWLTAPIGDCEHLLPAYRDASLHAIFTRHTIIGEHAMSRLMVDFMHVFGAICCVALCVMVLTLGGSAVEGGLADRASRMLLTNVYLMAVTGFSLWYFQLPPQEVGYPSVVTAGHHGAVDGHKTLMNLGFIGAFGISFLSVACHANARRGVPRWLILGQHGLSIVSFFVAVPFIVYRLWAFDPLDYVFGEHFELLVLLSFYPLLDLVNGWAIWRHEASDAYDWAAHRNDNVIALLVLTTTAVLAFGCSDKYYFFNSQLPLVWRMAIELVPSMLWLASGRMVPYLLRPFRPTAAA